MRVTASIVTVAAAAALAVAGCTPGGGSTPSATASLAPASGASPMSSASPSASPTPSIVAADCATEGIVPGRLGCVDTNLPVVGNPGEPALRWEPDYCSPDDGRFLFAAAPALVGLGGTSGGEIGRIDVYEPSITTAEGIHVGSTGAEVAAAYPANPSVTSLSGTQLVVLTGPGGFITIELADGWGADPLTVANIRIYAGDQDPNVPVYGTEDFAGACPMNF